MKKLHIATSRGIGEKCKEWAISNGYALYPAEDCDVFISVMYDKLIPQDYIDQHKCFNFHPGVLPWYRGAGAYSWAIINGEFESGVTLHEIDKDIDHGRVIRIERFPIDSDDTSGTLFKKAEDTILSMFSEWLPKLINGEYDSHEQESGRIYYRKDLDKVKDLTRFIKAFTFEGKEDAYYYDSKGDKIYIKYG